MCSSSDWDIVVVGGGLIGTACARHLTILRPDARVAIVAPPEPKCTFSEHDGVFASHYDEGRITRILDVDPIWSRLAHCSIDRYESIEKESGIKFFYESGYLCLGPANHDYISKVKDAADVHSVDYQVLDADALSEKFPALRPSITSSDLKENDNDDDGAFDPDEVTVRALYQATKAGHISPRCMVDAQLTICARHGVHIFSQYALSVSTLNGLKKALIKLSDGKEIVTSEVLVATGAFTSPLLTNNVPLPLEVQGRTVVFADVTDLMSAKPELELDRLPSVIKATVRNKETQRDGRLRYDLYCLPPAKYGNKWLIKIGTGDFPNYLTTQDEISAWFKGPASAPDVERLTQDLYDLYPCLSVCELSTVNCVLTHTPHGYPIIDWVSKDNIIAVAVGGNGAAAKSADEIGRLAACFICGCPDLSYDMSAFARPK